MCAGVKKKGSQSLFQLLNSKYALMCVNTAFGQNQEIWANIIINPLWPNSDQRQISPVKLWGVMGSAVMEKLAGDLLLGLKFLRLEILPTSFIDFLYEGLEELRSRYLGLKLLGELLVIYILFKISTKYTTYSCWNFHPHTQWKQLTDSNCMLPLNKCGYKYLWSCKNKNLISKISN